MKNLRLFFRLFVALGVLAIVSEPAAAQNAVPMLINYQGELRSPTTGEPVPDGSYEMLFRIYDVEFGGTPLWEGTHSSLNGNPVEVTNGIFNTILGSGTGNALDASLFNGADRWLEIRVGMEALEPRQRITSVAYAIISENSRLLGGKEASEFADHAHTHSGGDIVSGVVSEEWIDPDITRDAEMATTIATEIAVHTANADAHHSKTTSFADLTDTAADAQIPDNITISYAATAGDADTVDGMEGADLEESAEIDADIVAHALIADAHHAKYTNAEAIAAMGTKSDTNPLNHDKTTSLPWASITPIPAGFADGIDDDSGGDITAVGAGAGLTGGGVTGDVTLSAEFGGSGLANTVARSDHNHDTDYVNEGQVNSVTSAMLVDGSVTTADLNNAAVTTAKIASSAILDTHVGAGASIAGTKIAPDFGSQNVLTTGRVGIGIPGPGEKLDVGGNIRGSQLMSTVGSGTPPLSVTSDTLVANLNADTVDGKHQGVHSEWLQFDTGTARTLHTASTGLIQTTTTNYVIRLSCTHDNGIDWVAYNTGTRSEGTLLNAETQDFTLATDRDDLRLIFTPRVNDLNIVHAIFHRVNNRWTSGVVWDSYSGQ